MKTKSTLKEFLEIEQANLSEFETWWNEQAKKEPVNYPKTMGIGDWVEQFNSFCETRESTC